MLFRNANVNNLSGIEFLKHINAVSEQNKKLQKAFIPEISFPLRESLVNKPLRMSEIINKSDPKSKKIGTQQTSLAKYNFQQTAQQKIKSNAEEKFEKELEAAIEESKRLYELENQKEMDEIQRIYAEIEQIEKNNKDFENKNGNEKKRKYQIEENAMNKKIKEDEINKVEIISSYQLKDLSPKKT